MTEIGGSNRRRVQARAQRKDGWTARKRAAFLATLTETCNVTAGARAVGMNLSGLRALRARDGEFARLWDEALESGYERLENELLARALGMVSSGNNPDRPDDASTTPPPPFDAAFAFKVLESRVRRGGPRAASRPISQDEIDLMLMKRLDALAAGRQRA